MLTIIGTILGLLSSFLPDLIRIFTKAQDHKHQLELMDKQAQLQTMGFKFRAVESILRADAETSRGLYQYEQAFKNVSPWMDTLRASVRPVITYLFLVSYLVVKLVLLMTAVKQGYDPAQVVLIVWGDEDMAIWATVIAFWFGSRMRDKMEAVGWVVKEK